MKKKKVCPKCNKTKNTKCFKKNPVLNEEICTMCNKKVGTNKFYNKNSKQKSVIGKFTMNDDEKRYLAKQKGWHRVNIDCKGLQTIKNRVFRKRREDRIDLKLKQEKSKELNKKFLEGLYETNNTNN